MVRWAHQNSVGSKISEKHKIFVNVNTKTTHSIVFIIQFQFQWLMIITILETFPNFTNARQMNLIISQ